MAPVAGESVMFTLTLDQAAKEGGQTGKSKLETDDSVLAAPLQVMIPATAEVLVSQTVKDLVVGSGLAFQDAGEHELKGVPDRWHLYRVVNEST